MPVDVIRSAGGARFQRVANHTPDRDEIRLQFEATISGMEVEDLDDLLIEFGDLADSALRKIVPVCANRPVTC